MYNTKKLQRELALFSRGGRGSAQNLFRAVFWAVRAHGLGRRATIQPTFEAAVWIATKEVRHHSPGFIPTVA